MHWSLSPQGVLLLPWYFPVPYWYPPAPWLAHGRTALVPPGLLTGSCSWGWGTKSVCQRASSEGYP